MGSKRFPCMIHRTSVFKKLVQRAYSRHRLRKVQNVVHETCWRKHSWNLFNTHAQKLCKRLQDTYSRQNPSAAPHQVFQFFMQFVQVYLMIISRQHLSIQTELFCTIHLHNPRGCTARNSGCAPYPTFWRLFTAAQRIHTCQPLLGWWNQQAMDLQTRGREVKSSEGEDRNLKKKATEKKWVGCIGGCSGCHFLYMLTLPKMLPLLRWFSWQELIYVERALTSCGVKLWSTTVMNSPGTSIDPFMGLEQEPRLPQPADFIIGIRRSKFCSTFFGVKKRYNWIEWLPNCTVKNAISIGKNPCFRTCTESQVGTQIHHPPLTHEPSVLTVLSK